MNLYEDLGVGDDADQDAIRRAYKHKAGKLHPDRAGGSEDEFKKVQHAYMILHDPKKRKRYDSTGETNLEPNLDEKARKMIVTLFMELSQKNNFQKKNYLTGVMDQLTRAISKDTGTAATIQKTHDDVEYLVEHMGGDKRLGELFKIKLREISIERNKCLAHLEILKESKLILDRVKYNGEEGFQPMNHGSLGGTGGLFTHFTTTA